MTVPFKSRDPRLVGAALALALDVTMLAVAALLVFASWSPAFALVLAGAVGTVIAPALGWRYARPASDSRVRGWVGDALRSLGLAIAAIVAGLVLIQGVTVPVEGGIGGRVAFVLYAIAMDTIAVAALTIVSALLLGIPWTRIMRSFGRSFGEG